VDSAVMNSGSLGADLEAGEVTMEQILNVYPVIGEYRVVSLDAAGVRELLEHSYALHYGFAQMSGVEAIYDGSQPLGARLIDVRICGRPLDEGARYTVASSTFLALGGDDYSMLRGGEPVRTGPRLSQVLIDYFRAADGPLAVPKIGRQRDLARVAD